MDQGSGAAKPESDAAVAAGRGGNPSRMRDHNERALLSALRDGPLSGKALAAWLGVSAQTASVITRELERAGLIEKGPPLRGRVGKPQVPWALRADGAFGLGLHIGRRGAGLMLMDLTGGVRLHLSERLPAPRPDQIEAFFRKGLIAAQDVLGDQAGRITGLGVAAPFRLDDWSEALGPGTDIAAQWRDYDLRARLGALSDLPLRLANDVTMACAGELHFGASTRLNDFAYFHIGALLGGGVVMGGRVLTGARGNAGAFGSIPLRPADVPQHQLLHHASLYLLEDRLSAHLGRPVDLKAEPTLWETESDLVGAWLQEAAAALAMAALGVSAALDLPDVVIDGVLPERVRSDLVAATAREAERFDQRGLHRLAFRAGGLGRMAGVMGAAHLPLLGAVFQEGSHFA